MRGASIGLVDRMHTIIEIRETQKAASNLGISARGDPAAQSRSPSLSYSKSDFGVLPDNNHSEKSVAAISAMI
jgi:hypothetical protein